MILPLPLLLATLVLTLEAPSPAPAPALARTASALPLLTLPEALSQAQAGNLDLQIAKARLGQARTLSRKAWSKYLPQLSAGASVTRYPEDAILGLPTAFAIRDLKVPTSAGNPTDPSLPFPYDPIKPFSARNLPGYPTSFALVPYGLQQLEFQKEWQWGAQLELKQALLAPEVGVAIKNAELAEEATVATVEAARREVLFGAAQAYFAAAGYKETIRVQERIVGIGQQHEADAQQKLAQGLGLRLAVLRARTDRVRAEQDLLRAQYAYGAARLALATLLDRDAEFDVELPPVPQAPGDAEALAEGAAHERPDVQAVRKGLELADGQRSGVFAKYAPTAGLSGAVRHANITGYTGKNDEWQVTLGLQWVLWDGGLREAELRETAEKVAESKAALRKAEHAARDEVRRAALDAQSASATRAKAREQAELAREAHALAEKSYQQGLATWLEVSDATGALLGAELALINSSLDAQLAVLRLARAAGTFEAAPR